MKNNRITLVLLVLLLISGCSSSQRKDKADGNGKIAIIFETDMGNDIDDALALDMLYKYLAQDRINLLGISVNKDSPYSPRFIDVMNTWYGYPDIPIAMVKAGTEDAAPVNFARETCLYTKANGTTFKRTLPDNHVFTESTRFYRETLAGQKDNSVTIVSVGFLTNLARLLDTPGDDISPLTGKELIARKVKKLSLMGGNFNGINPREYNIVMDIPSSRKIFDQWPTEIIVSPLEVGNQVLYPGSTIEANLNYTFESPLVVAYKSYLPMPYDRPTWDLTCVLHEAEPGGGYFSYSPKGTVSITETGESLFEETPQGKHRYLIADEAQAKLIANRFVELITSPIK